MKRRVTFGKGCVKIYQIGEKSSGQKTEDRSVGWALRAKGIVWPAGTWK
jgi:hypothetical protein